MSPAILVTGGAGFIGANFVHYWLRSNPDGDVVVIDKLTYAGNRANLFAADASSRFHFVAGDICDQALVRRTLAEHRVTAIVHFAAESHVDRSIDGPDAFVHANVVGTHALLEAARHVWGKANGKGSHLRFHHVSTDEVYGSLGPSDAPFTESSRYDPSSPYAATKAASDHLVRAYGRTFGLNFTISNCSNNYGPHQFPEKLIPLCILNALNGKPLPIYGDGCNVRDWLYVEDHCRGIERVLKAGVCGETYNIGARSELDNLSLVKTMCRVLDEEFAQSARLAGRFPSCPAARGAATSALIRFVADRPGHDFRYGIDNRKIERELGFHSATRFEDGLRATVRWYLDNEPWWQAILDGSYRNWVARHYHA